MIRKGDRYDVPVKAKNLVVRTVARDKVGVVGNIFGDLLVLMIHGSQHSEFVGREKKFEPVVSAACGPSKIRGASRRTPGAVHQK